MSLVSVAEVITETGATKEAFSFTDQNDFEVWIQGKIDWISGKVRTMVGDANYDSTPVIGDIKMGELYWVTKTMMGKRSITLATVIEGGFAIGSLRIDGTAKASADAGKVADALFDKAMVLLFPYMTTSYRRYLIVEDEDE